MSHYFSKSAGANAPPPALNPKWRPWYNAIVHTRLHSVHCESYIACDIVGSFHSDKIDFWYEIAKFAISSSLTACNILNGNIYYFYY